MSDEIPDLSEHVQDELAALDARRATGEISDTQYSVARQALLDYAVLVARGDVPPSRATARPDAHASQPAASGSRRMLLLAAVVIGALGAALLVVVVGVTAA